MTTSNRKFWQILQTKMPQGKWLHIKDIYKIIQNNYQKLTPEDNEPVTSYNKEPTWRRNVRNTLQSHKTSGDILYDGKANYKIPLYFISTLSPEKITWIKNVKRNKGAGWAYDDVNCNKPFLLHWPTSRKGSASNLYTQGWGYYSAIPKTQLCERNQEFDCPLDTFGFTYIRRNNQRQE